MRDQELPQHKGQEHEGNADAGPDQKGLAKPGQFRVLSDGNKNILANEQQRHGDHAKGNGDHHPLPKGAADLSFITGAKPLSHQRPYRQRDAKRQKEQRLVIARCQRTGGKAGAVDPPHGDGVGGPDADGGQLANHQRRGKTQVLAEMIPPAQRCGDPRGGGHAVLSGRHCQARRHCQPWRGARRSCQIDGNCGIA